jgi:hypothetical protein
MCVKNVRVACSMLARVREPSVRCFSERVTQRRVSFSSMNSMLFVPIATQDPRLAVNNEQRSAV